MSHNELVVINTSYTLTLEEFCHATHANKETIIQMVEYQLLHPAGQQPEDWRFNSSSLRRGRIATSFYHDLEINMQGVALALELLEKLEYLQHELEHLQKLTKF